ncbi:MAG TPA: DAK2 domain-containing protein [Patescibacteria group bacterium]|nr:DAK2 domain-containing protein [Patescibacteria group bacterium]
MFVFKITDIADMLAEGADEVISNRDNINSINVFPVPDADTGSNMASTLLPIKNAKVDSQRPQIFIEQTLQQVLKASRGNSGIMITSYLSGLLNSLTDEQIGSELLIKSFKNGADSAKSAVEAPKKGTMLDVMYAFYKSFDANLDISQNAFDKALTRTKEALIATESQMKVLSDHKVVDAGALGFTLFIYGFSKKITRERLDISFLNLKKVNEEKLEFGKFPYEVVFIVEEPMFSAPDLKSMFHAMGNSIDIVEVAGSIKVHIHTDNTDVVRETAELVGNIVDLKITDMRNTVVHA